MFAGCRIRAKKKEKKTKPKPEVSSRDALLDAMQMLFSQRNPVKLPVFQLDFLATYPSQAQQKQSMPFELSFLSIRMSCCLLTAAHPQTSTEIPL